MARKPFRSVLALASIVVGLMWVVPRVSGQVFVGTPAPKQFSAQGQPSTKNGEWPHNAADMKGTRYSPLDQINASNFNRLEVAWRFKPDNLGPFPEYKLEGTPLMVKGVLYTTAGSRRSVIALDAKTGELIWSHSLREGRRAAVAPRQLSGRGVSYWTDGQGDERVIYITTGYRLVELNAKTGAVIDSFGTHGIVDLKVGVVKGLNQQIDLETGEIGVHSTAAVARDMIIVGSAFREGATVETHNNTKGLARAFDVRTGKRVWQFNTIPRPGEFGNDTWEGDSWATNGNVGIWNQITVDEDLGLVYLPVETPTSDYYGGHRPGNDLFAETLVCLDLKTGQRKWHFQFVHHPLWNFDMAAAPILADITVGGRAIKAVAVPSKQAWLYVFDRVTGQPVWPIEERPVPQSDVPGEKTSPTQPYPPDKLRYARNYFNVPDDLIDFTPELRAAAIERAKRVPLGSHTVQPADAWRREGAAGRDYGRHRDELARRRFRSRDARRLCTGWEYPGGQVARCNTAEILGSSIRHRRGRAAHRRSLGAWGLLRRRFRVQNSRGPARPAQLEGARRRPARGCGSPCRRGRWPEYPRDAHRQTAIWDARCHRSRSRRGPVPGAAR